MYILKKNMRIRGYLVLCLGIICIVGCQGSYVRDTKVSNKDDSGDKSINDAGNVEVKKKETKMRTPILEGADRASTNTIKTVRKEDNKRDTYIKEIVEMDEALSSNSILVEVPIEVADKRKDNNEKTVIYDETGIASFISDEYVGRMTASGVRYDRNKMTAAHPSLPFDTKVLVTNLRNKRTVEVIIIDRFTPSNDRILNVSHSAAVELDLVESGVAKIGIKIISISD
jgi:rare lipoprotein A